MTNLPGTLTLIGSGELGETMARVHRAILAQIAPPITAVFLDTPAGFEVNADEISSRAVEYFKQRFDITLTVASFRSKNHATARQVETALHALRRADYIFAGPGSPSYAVQHWRGAAVWDTLIARWLNGTPLVFANAGAIALSRCALPVYEIFKAGHPVTWIDGLDLLGAFGLKLALIPHWNNAEGKTYDTRFCFMGEERLRILEAQLSFDMVMLGIDEHTALTLDVNAQQGTVSGAGNVTVRYAGHESVYSAGATIPFAHLRAAHWNAPASVPAEPFAPTLLPAPEVLTTTVYLDQLARALKEADKPHAQRELIDHAHEAMHELAHTWQFEPTRPSSLDTAALIEWLIALRAQLRAAKQFTFADQVRQQLSQLGIALEDTPAGTTWRHVNDSR